jgi:LmbE family N-acetylglucosaminyl deacetylase
MKNFTLLFLLLCVSGGLLHSQTPRSYSSSELYLFLQRLQKLGSVLYLAAHPDDENTRLLAYFSKERLFRTGYLSLTRGDGGQNLIGNEQGIELGLIRTNELLGARSIDGAQQFFSRAYDFGYSKSTDEALKIWDRQKILSDIVWVIRRFQPDVIITRFPEDNRAGHGQHSASAVLGREAFALAGDRTKFPEQFEFGVQPWSPTRIVWNNYMPNDSALKLDVGGYNRLLGRSNGEIAASSRSQHKSQGFGVPATRGRQIEQFLHTQGTPARLEIFDGIDTSWSRIGQPQISLVIQKIIDSFDFSNPSSSVAGLVALYRQLNSLPKSPLVESKKQDVVELIEHCGGIWLEATTDQSFAVHGDSLKVMLTVNNRTGIPVLVSKYWIDGRDSSVSIQPKFNENVSWQTRLRVDPARRATQPYWLEHRMAEGSFDVREQMLIGSPLSPPAYEVVFETKIFGEQFSFRKPVMRKITDPVKGEVYHPLVIAPVATISSEPGIVLFNRGSKPQPIRIMVQANTDLSGYGATISKRTDYENRSVDDSFAVFRSGAVKQYPFTIDPRSLKGGTNELIRPFTIFRNRETELTPYLNMNRISYDHIPDITYFYHDAVKAVPIDLKIAGKRVGYIEGAGDKVPVSLQQMGYRVDILSPEDISEENLRIYDAVITGVRAYNVHPSLKEKQYVLLDYVKNGGNLVMQYNTANQIGTPEIAATPESFSISRTRITDERSPVVFQLPGHRVLNFPNRITPADFDGWVQERGIYFAEKLSTGFQSPLAFTDPGEEPQSGGLVIAQIGKGTLVYTGIAFFRQLPAGAPGAYRLMANIIALNKSNGK